MNKGLLVFLLLNSFFLKLSAQDTVSFEKADEPSQWKEVFYDKGTDNWQKNWFLDGLRAVVSHSKRGMQFTAGQVDGDHACHAVLWTKKTFSGDIKITYDYMRSDAQDVWVNILYFHAEGIGTPPYDKDISKWNSLRMIPYMSAYFNNMKAYHISYAAYGPERGGEDYIRLRLYPRHPDSVFSSSTEIKPAFFNTGLFKPGVIYHITVIKKDDSIYFQAEGDGRKELFSWKLTNAQKLQEGRIGLRHMFTRSSVYKNFKVFQQKVK